MHGFKTLISYVVQNIIAGFYYIGCISFTEYVKIWCRHTIITGFPTSKKLFLFRPFFRISPLPRFLLHITASAYSCFRPFSHIATDWPSAKYIEPVYEVNNEIACKCIGRGVANEIRKTYVCLSPVN